PCDRELIRGSQPFSEALGERLNESAPDAVGNRRKPIDPIIPQPALDQTYGRIEKLIIEPSGDILAVVNQLTERYLPVYGQRPSTFEAGE
ncbi:MAG: hypothetical protein DWP92_03220, partial [Armatimonadetes bacterium]